MTVRREPELETVTAHDDLPELGVPVTIDEVDGTVTLERELLTALIWAPADLTAAIVRALSAIPATAPLFYLPGHAAVYARLVASVDDGAPLDPASLAALAADPASSTRFRNLLMELASPNPHGPWPVPTDADLPELAGAVVDQWLRRGYRALLDRMGTVLLTERSAELGAHWAALSAHQQLAEERRRTVRRALGEL